MSGLRKTLRPPADKLRVLELTRLDRLQVAHWNAAIKGSVKATRIVLDVMRQRAVLLGLDARHSTGLH